MALAFLAAVGPGLWITALNVKYRDFRYVVPFLVQFGLYVSPVGYSSAVIRQRFGDGLFLLYSLNPMVARDRRFPLGDPGRRGSDLLARLPALAAGGRAIHGPRNQVLPQDGKDIRRRDIGRRSEVRGQRSEVG